MTNTIFTLGGLHSDLGSLDQTPTSVSSVSFVSAIHPNSKVDREAWIPPQPLEDKLPPVPPFAPTLLPEALRPLAEDVAERMQVPLDFTAVALVATLAGVCNRRISIQPWKFSFYRWFFDHPFDVAFTR